MTQGPTVVSLLLDAPAPLRARVAALLRDDGRDPDLATPAEVLATAERALRDVIERSTFGRDGALDLLAVDTLTTLAFEMAAVAGDAVSLSTAEAMQRLSATAAA